MKFESTNKLGGFSTAAMAIELKCTLEVEDLTFFFFIVRSIGENSWMCTKGVHLFLKVLAMPQRCPKNQCDCEIIWFKLFDVEGTDSRSLVALTLARFS